MYHARGSETLSPPLLPPFSTPNTQLKTVLSKVGGGEGGIWLLGVSLRTSHKAIEKLIVVWGGNGAMPGRDFRGV